MTEFQEAEKIPPVKARPIVKDKDLQLNFGRGQGERFRGALINLRDLSQGKDLKTTKQSDQFKTRSQREMAMQRASREYETMMELRNQIQEAFQVLKETNSYR